MEDADLPAQIEVGVVGTVATEAVAPLTSPSQCKMQVGKSSSAGGPENRFAWILVEHVNAFDGL